MQVAQIIAGAHSEAAGTTYWVRRMTESLAALGADAEILCLGPAPAGLAHGARACSFPADFQTVPGLGSLLFSRGLAAAAEARARDGAVLHASGLWRMPTISPARAARRTGARLVLSPHGMLGPGALQFSASAKRLFAALAQNRALARVDCFHATMEQEFKDIRAYGLKAPVAVIPIGVDLPPPPPPLPEGGPRTALYLGRLHPKKGIDRLLSAWAATAARFPAWRLRIVGPAEGDYGARLQALAGRLPRVAFEPGLYGPAKDQAFAEADLFILPTLDENFGIVVTEALANGAPVICTKGAPWAGLEAHGCGWWIDHGVEPLAACLNAAMALPRTALREMGLKGRDWMARDFAWERAAAEMIAVYRWLKEGGAAPACVRLS